MDCSGGDVKDEETGFARKADALARVMAQEVRKALSDIKAFACDGLNQCTAVPRIDMGVGLYRCCVHCVKCYEFPVWSIYQCKPCTCASLV